MQLSILTNYYLHLVDTLPPEILYCPGDVSESVELGNTGKSVTWEGPIASDVSGPLSSTTQSHYSGDFFTIGKTRVNYTFVDSAGNRASCKFSVDLFSGKLCITLTESKVGFDRT